MARTRDDDDGATSAGGRAMSDTIAVCSIDEGGGRRTLGDIPLEELRQMCGTFVLDNARMRRLIVLLGMVAFGMPDAEPISPEDRSDIDWIVAARLSDVGLVDEARALVAALRLEAADAKRAIEVTRAGSPIGRGGGPRSRPVRVRVPSRAPKR